MFEQVRCEVCGVKGHKDKWYKEPYYDEYGKLKNKPYGDRGFIGHREKILYFPYGNGYSHHGYRHRRLAFTLCDPCHVIAPDRANKCVFTTREQIHKHFDRQFKFRGLAKNMTFTNETKSTGDTSIPMSMLLYTHYNREFTKGLIVKIPGSDDASTKDNIFKESSFKYVIVNKVYPKETIPEWALECGVSEDKPFISDSGRQFDYYVEVLPCEEPA
jgi:hypothetical protein